MAAELAAVCPSHPDAVSVATCARCGRFLCAPCVVVAVPPVCADCAPRWFDPLGILATPFGLNATLRNATMLLAPLLGRVLLVTLVFALPAAGLAFIPNTQSNVLGRFQLTTVYDLFAGTICMIACTALFIGVAEGRSLTIFQALREGTARWGRVTGAQIRSGLWVAFLSVLLLVPGLWKFVMLIFVNPAAIRLPREDPLEVSSDLVRGRWYPVLGLVLVVGSLTWLPAALLFMFVNAASSRFGVPSPLVEVVTHWISTVSTEVGQAFWLCGFYGSVRSTGKKLPPMRWASGD